MAVTFFGDAYKNVRKKLRCKLADPGNETTEPKTRRSWSQVKIMKIYRELKCEHLGKIEDKDLYFKNWPKTRRDSAACLPLLYTVGKRYIKLYKAFPAGYKIMPVPRNLHEVSPPERQKQFEDEARKSRLTCKFYICPEKKLEQAKKAEKKKKKKKPKKKKKRIEKCSCDFITY